jgi:hypothetical protein
VTKTALAIPPDPRGMLRRFAAAARQAEYPLRRWWAMPARMNRAIRGLAATAPSTDTDLDQLADSIHPGGHVDNC